MSESCDGPGCAFNMTYVTAALLGFYAAPLALGGGPGLAPLELLLFGGIALLAARELWSRPARLWWRSLAGGIALAGALAFGGGLALEHFGVGGVTRTVLVVAVLAPSVLAPRVLVRSPLVPGRSRESPG